VTDQLTAQNIKLLDNIGFLITYSNQFKEGLLDKYLSAENITPTQTRTLFYLYHFKHRRPCDISKALNIDNSATTRMLDRLEKKALIQRIASPKDRRSIKIILTKKGHKIVKRVRPLADKAMNELTQVLTKEETTQLCFYLKKIVKPMLVEHFNTIDQTLDPKE